LEPGPEGEGGGIVQRSLILLVGATLLVLSMVALALAATPTDVYNDFAADGDLDGNYTQAELNAVLTDATLAQYGDSGVLDDLKKKIRGETVRSDFPFTGFELGLAVLGGIVLVGGGIALRRAGR
jgi:hypothetical protein